MNTITKAALKKSFTILAFAALALGGTVLQASAQETAPQPPKAPTAQVGTRVSAKELGLHAECVYEYQYICYANGFCQYEYVWICE